MSKKLGAMNWRGKKTPVPDCRVAPGDKHDELFKGESFNKLRGVARHIAFTVGKGEGKGGHR